MYVKYYLITYWGKSTKIRSISDTIIFSMCLLLLVIAVITFILYKLQLLLAGVCNNCSNFKNIYLILGRAKTEKTVDKR